MEISVFVAVLVAASVGISPSMAWSVLNQLLSKRSTLFKRITAEETPTYTSTVRSGGTVRGLVKEPYAWDWWSEIAHITRAVLTRIPGTTQREVLQKHFVGVCDPNPETCTPAFQTKHFDFFHTPFQTFKLEFTALVYDSG